MKGIVLYCHDGSKNHGCEAIVRSTMKILGQVSNLRLYSFNKTEDVCFGLDNYLEIIQTNIKRDHGAGGRQTLKEKLKKYIIKIVPLSMIMFLQKKLSMRGYQNIVNTKGDVFISVGGDLYCYGSYAVLDYLNAKLNKHSKTVLWGCSITPQRIKEDKTLQADLKRYSLITARESMTYNALLENGINRNTHLFPDPAFVLDVQETSLPRCFLLGNTVGINLSPMVQRLETEHDLAYKNVEHLIRHILETTDMHICLIAHVIWEGNNDLVPLTALYNEFKGSNRLSLVGQTQNTCELKYIISKCRFMVAARTHASIAAYSTQVPTLVIGYSVKARGIARDIFGTEEGYVLPIQHIRKENELTDAFIGLQKNEASIRARYKEFMPTYINRAYQGREEIKKLFNLCLDPKR